MSRDPRTLGVVHNDHVWLCNANIKEFNAKYGGKEPTPPKIENTPDISKKVSEKWRRAPKPTGVLLEIVTDAESVIELPETCTEAMTNGDPHKLALSLMAKGYEPGAIALEMGSIERFSIRIPTENGNREVRIRRAIEVAGDQALFEDALTKRGQVVFETELDRIRACCLPRNGLSTYSKDLFRMFDRHSRGPRCGLLKGRIVGEPPNRKLMYEKFSDDERSTSSMAQWLALTSAERTQSASALSRRYRCSQCSTLLNHAHAMPISTL